MCHMGESPSDRQHWEWADLFYSISQINALTLITPYGDTDAAVEMSFIYDHPSGVSDQTGSLSLKHDNNSSVFVSVSDSSELKW